MSDNEAPADGVPFDIAASVMNRHHPGFHRTVSRVTLVIGSLISLVTAGLLVTAAVAAQRGDLVRPAAAPASRTLQVWTARAIATVLAEVGSEFEKSTGYTLRVTSDLPAGFERRLSAGEKVDVVITGSVVLDEWIAKGRILPATRADIARSGIGVGVRAGAAKPDISSADAFKRALLDAKSIAYLRVGSGLHVDRVIAQLGIADAIKHKVTRPESDIVSELVAKGKIELGIVVITQILTTPGVALAGPLPPGLQSQHTFTAGVTAGSVAPEPARALVGFLRGPSARRVIQRQGMEAVEAGAGR